MGNIALAEKDFPNAERFYRIALTKGPPVESVMVNIGIAIAEQCDIAKGIAALEKALEINPASEQTQINLQYYRSKLEPLTTP